MSGLRIFYLLSVERAISVMILNSQTACLGDNLVFFEKGNLNDEDGTYRYNYILYIIYNLNISFAGK